MKSFVMTCVFLFSCGLLAAEDMKFVTLLSQPVGSFSRVELLDTSKPAEIFHLNFCNTDASGGTIAVSGSDTYPVQAEKLRVLDGATLGGNIKTFEVDTITVGADSTFDGFTGGTLHVTTTAPARIIVDEDSNENNHSGSATFIHGKAVTINNADFYRMNIDGVAYLKQAASSANQKTLSWKQVSPSGTTDYPQGYVLTSHSGLTPDEDDDNSSTGDDDNGSGSTKTWHKVYSNSSGGDSAQCPSAGFSSAACPLSITYKGGYISQCSSSVSEGAACGNNTYTCYTNCNIYGADSGGGHGCYYYANIWTCK